MYLLSIDSMRGDFMLNIIIYSPVNRYTMSVPEQNTKTALPFFIILPLITVTIGNLATAESDVERCICAVIILAGVGAMFTSAINGRLTKFGREKSQQKIPRKVNIIRYTALVLVTLFGIGFCVLLNTFGVPNFSPFGISGCAGLFVGAAFASLSFEFDGLVSSSKRLQKCIKENK